MLWIANFGDSMLRTFERVVQTIAAGNDLDLALTGLTRDELGRFTPQRPTANLAPSGSRPDRQAEKVSSNGKNR